MIGHHFGNTKIGNLRIHIFIQKDILRLDIAMNDVMAVGMLQRIGQAHANFQHRVQAELMLLHIFLQSDAIHVFHHNVLIIALADNIINIDDIRMH